MTSTAFNRADPAAPSPAKFVDVRRNNVNWTVRSDVCDELMTRNGPPIEQWLTDGTATVIKSGDHRTVYRVALPSGAYYLKHYRVPDWKALLQNVVRPSKAELEWNAIEQIESIGIPTVTPSALGLRKRGPVVTDSFIVTQAINNVETLQELVERHAESHTVIPATVRQQLARQLGGLVARLHDNDLLHRDLHAGNLLVRVEPDDTTRLWLIDLHAVVRKTRLTDSRRAGTHALLANFLNRHVTPADRLRYLLSCWNASENHRPQRRYEKRDALHVIEQSCDRWAARACEKADRKWLNGHRKLTIVERSGTQCRSIAKLGAAIASEMVDVAVEGKRTGTEGHTAVEQIWRQRLIDRGIAPSQQIMTWSSQTDAEVRGRQHSFSWLGQPRQWSPARVIWEMGHALLRRGIATAKPLLFAEHHSGEQHCELLATESTDSEFVNPATCAEKVLRQSAKLLRRLHDHRVLHARLSPDCFVNQADERGVALAEIDAVYPVSHISRETAVRQLACLLNGSDGQSISPARRLRFLLAYLDRGQRSDWKSWWRDIQLMLQHNDPPTDADTFQKTRRRFLRAAVTAAAILFGCQTPKHQPAIVLPARHSVRSGQLLVLSNFRLPRDHAVVRDLVRLRKDVTVSLQLPKQREDVVVYIFTTEKEYRDYLNVAFPGLPNRRAYFVGTPRELAVYTYWGDRIQEDLRHEYTHGLLHAGLKSVPLWIDEGLAEYFEVGGPRPGLANSDYPQRLAVSVSNGWQPNLKELEKLEEFSRMQHVHYQEAWAWVHFLLHHSEGTRQLLLDYLQDLRTSRRPKPLSERLAKFQPAYRERMIAHITMLQNPGVLSQRVSKPASKSTIRSTSFP